MFKLSTEFKPYCERHGIKVLKDDLLFIEQALNQIPKDRHRLVMRDYIDEWKSGMDKATADVQMQNLGRKSANTFLRELVE